MKKNKLFIFVLIMSILLGQLTIIHGKITTEAAELSDVIEFVDTNYGIIDNAVSGKKLNILSNDIEIIDAQISNLLFLEEKISSTIYKIYILCPIGIIKTFELSTDNGSYNDWINKISNGKEREIFRKRLIIPRI